MNKELDLLKVMIDGKIRKIAEDLREFTDLAREYYTGITDKTDLDRLRSVTIVTGLRRAVDEILDLKSAITISDKEMQEALDEEGITARTLLAVIMLNEMEEARKRMED